MEGTTHLANWLSGSFQGLGPHQRLPVSAILLSYVAQPVLVSTRNEGCLETHKDRRHCAPHRSYGSRRAEGSGSMGRSPNLALAPAALPLVLLLQTPNTGLLKVCPVRELA